MSWLGNYGNGMGLIPPGVDLAMIAALFLAGASVAAAGQYRTAIHRR